MLGPFTLTQELFLTPELSEVLALVPLIVSGVRPGHEIEHPMALVIVGGLVSSVLVNLFVLPALYLRFAPALTPGPEHAAPNPDAIRLGDAA